MRKSAWLLELPSRLRMPLPSCCLRMLADDLEPCKTAMPLSKAAMSANRGMHADMPSAMSALQAAAMVSQDIACGLGVLHAKQSPHIKAAASATRGMAADSTLQGVGFRELGFRAPLRVLQNECRVMITAGGKP